MADNADRGKRNTRKGVVSSKSGNKTIVVKVERRSPHPVYGKVVSSFKKYYAHDEENTAKVGDVVEICEARPMSRLKRWRLLKVV